MTDPIRLLHVEDDLDFAEMTATYLEHENDRFSVTTVPDASSGRETLTQEEFDCVVSDYDMPGDNGIEFLRTFREQNPDLPFILYTGKGSEEVAIDAISAGVTDYLQKESGADQYTVLANRIINAVESYWSEQKLAEQNKDLQRYKHMINSMDEAACIYDESGRFVVVNEYLADWYNTTQEELIGHPSNLIPYICEQSDHSDPYQALLDGRRDQLSGEIEVEFSNQGDVVLDYLLTRLIVDGELEGIVGVARDITEQKERERDLRRERDRLDEFAGVVSHDIQNPILVANSRLELAQEECESEHLAAIETALDRITRISEDVLWLAREGRDIGAVDAVVLTDPIDNAWDLVGDRAEHAKLHYTDEMSSPITIEADDDRLCQLFENLFRNAIKHGGADITVTVGTMDSGFYIKDDGPGIPEERRTDVFSAGYSTADDGTGFGLSIVKQVVEAHGWDIRVTESAAGGARFEITGVEPTTV